MTWLAIEWEEHGKLRRLLLKIFRIKNARVAFLKKAKYRRKMGIHGNIRSLIVAKNTVLKHLIRKPEFKEELACHLGLPTRNLTLKIIR